jgi:hypothetical protein
VPTECSMLVLRAPENARRMSTLRRPDTGEAVEDGPADARS